MATIAPSAAAHWNWRAIAFTALAVVFGLQGFIVGMFILAPGPWAAPGALPSHLTRWHVGQAAMAAGLLSGALLLIGAWRPQRKPVLFQLFGLLMVQAVVIALLRIQPLGVDLMGWINLTVGILLLALYPQSRELLSLTGEGPRSRPLLALTAAIGILLLWDAGRNLLWQWIGIGGESARRYFWLETALINVTLVVAGILTAIKRPGWPVLGVLLGIGYVYLGIVALTIPAETGSWGTIGGAVAVLLGAGYSAVTLWEARHARASDTPARMTQVG